MSHQALTGILTEQKLISDCRYRVIESSSLVPVLFREVFSHPYISRFHLLVMVFLLLVIIIINFKFLFSISSDEISPRSVSKCSQIFYQSVAIHLKYVLLVLLLRLLKYLGL